MLYKVRSNEGPRLTLTKFWLNQKFFIFQGSRGGPAFPRDFNFFQGGGEGVQ